MRSAIEVQVVSKLRSQRIADRIREELSEILLHDISDPRLGGVSITDVAVDRELAYAEIYVSAVEGSQRAETVLAGFDHARGYLRRELAQRVELRTFPRLRFHWDPTPERAENLERLIASLHDAAEEDSIQPKAKGKAPHPDVEDTHA